MNTTLLLGSETYAYKGKKLLSRLGIPSKIVKSIDTTSGCSFGLTVRKEDLYRIIIAFRDNGIEYTVK